MTNLLVAHIMGTFVNMAQRFECQEVGSEVRKRYRNTFSQLLLVITVCVIGLSVSLRLF
jgi:predicted nucleic acid-binding Zn ribbon protein